jgi:hypothetical protein
MSIGKGRKTMKQYQTEILKAYAVVFSSMDAFLDVRQSKSQLDDKLSDAIYTSQLILVGEFGKKSKVPENLKSIAWTKENGAVVEERWITRLCRMSEDMQSVNLQSIYDMAEELVDMVCDYR